MILQALKGYYDRKASEPESGLAPEGWEWREFEYLAVIEQDGRFFAIQDVREGDGKIKRGRRYLVPSLGEKKGGGIKSNLFWENIEYLFGIPVTTRTKAKPDGARVVLQHQAFCEKVSSIGGNSEALDAVRRFLQNADNVQRVQADPLWKDVFSINPFMLLALRGSGPVTEETNLREAVNFARSSSKTGGARVCLVSGAKGETANLEPPIKGVRGAQATGASLVSFNLSAFNSFGKQQGANAPLSKSASAAYASALNHLLGKDSVQRLQIGDATTVFWADRNCELESKIAAFFSEPEKDDPDRGVNAVKSLLRSIETGAFSADDQVNRFYVLGLAPNAARIAVRFWQVDTVQGMSKKIARHFHDLEIVHGPRDKDIFSLFRLLTSIAALGKADNIPPNLAGDTMRAILEGQPYPKTLLQAAIRRNRAEQSVTYIRAALIKACINRETRFYNPTQQEELKMALDVENANIGYRLGRLFAALEKIQLDASPGINATIRDRFYGAASSTPVAVFGNLMRLKNHHLAKMESAGLRVHRERLLGEILSGIGDFPAHLPMADQGRFAIGYYHQMQDFYTKKEKAE